MSNKCDPIAVFDSGVGGGDQRSAVPDPADAG